MTSLAIRSHGMDISALPIHLQESVSTACRCSSCRRIMSSGRLLPLPSPSSSDLAHHRQAMQAGFKVPRHLLDDIEASIASGSSYLPPFIENVRYSFAAGNISDLLIGGTSAFYSRIFDDDTRVESSNWQFCTHCLGLHLGFWQEKDRRCGCFVCSGQETGLPLGWRRK
jgi:hypothetical protein